MSVSIKDIQLQSSDQAVIPVPNMTNVVMIFYADLNNTDNIFVGDKTVQRYVSGQQIARGLVFQKYGQVSQQYDNFEGIFVADSNDLWCVGVKGDILHILITQSEIMTAINTLIAAQKKLVSQQITAMGKISSDLSDSISTIKQKLGLS
jgi:hypothetical protein